MCKHKSNIGKYVCFKKDLTLATRIIGFIGVAISVILVTALINDLTRRNFEISRKIALGLGLDWRHFHTKMDFSEKGDPEGKIISVMLTFVALVLFLTNTLLFLATILERAKLTFPWLICESLSCLSKIVTLIIHVITERDKLDQVFITGSLIYIVLMVWWLVVVFIAQSLWPNKKYSTFELSTIRNGTDIEFSTFLNVSLEPYTAKDLYTTI